MRAESGSSNRPGSTGPPARPFRDQLGFSYRVLVRQCCCGATLVHTTHRRAGRRAEQAGCNRAGLCVRPVDLQVRPPCWVHSNWQFEGFSHHICPPLQPPPLSVCQYQTGARPERADIGEVCGRTAHQPVSGPPPHLLPFPTVTSSFPPCHATHTCLGPAEWVCRRPHPSSPPHLAHLGRPTTLGEGPAAPLAPPLTVWHSNTSLNHH